MNINSLNNQTKCPLHALTPPTKLTVGKYSQVEFLKIDSFAKIIYCYRHFHGKINYGPLGYQE